MATGAAKLGFPLSSHASTSLPRNTYGNKPTALLRRRPISASLAEDRRLVSDSESHLVEALLGIQGRGRSAAPNQLKDVELAVKELEELGGILDPTDSSLIEGRWQLIFTTRPGTASPIQRTFVGVDFFSVFQEIHLRADEPRVTNIVNFSDAVGELKVEAEATIKDGKRILFRFDRAAFSFKFLPFKVPYPVPFKLLGDEAKGWLDTTYLSHTGNIRISKGNKGTTFVLQKRTEPRQRLLSAISVGRGVEMVINELVSLGQSKSGEEFELQEGRWKMIWASQMKGENWSEIAATGLKGLQIIRKDGQIENVVDLFPGSKLFVKGKIIRSKCNNYAVTMSDGTYMMGFLQFPLAIKTEFAVELLYADDKIRISRGYNDRTFVHLNIKG